MSAAAPPRSSTRPLTGRARGFHTARVLRPGPGLVILALSLLAPAHLAARPASAAPAEEAETLHRLALADLARNTIDLRRRAMQRLERAAQLDPERADIELELARTYQRMGFLKQARRRFERVVERNPADAPARRGLAALWRRDYLKYLDTTSLVRAVDHLERAVSIEPRDTDSWVGLAALQTERGQPRSAAAAARHAGDLSPQRADAMLANAGAAWRTGDPARADSLFRLAIPRLARSARARFEDIGPVAADEDTARLRRLPPEGRAEFLRRFWADHDPDPTTPRNEAQLEYWARVAHAYFLFYDPRREEWDLRGEVYVRYGPPSRAVYNPVGASGYLTIRDVGVTRVNGLFPVNSMVWSYPELGMDVVLEDRTLNEFYLSPIALQSSTDPVPDPESLAAHPERFGTRSGRGVFPSLAPGVRPLPVDGVFARFEGREGARLLALLATPGTPDDTTHATMVVFDSTRREVARVARRLGPSACDPAATRSADFAAELPPGDYLVALAVAGGTSARGVRREDLRIERPRGGLAMSDVVVSCGGAQVLPGGPGEPPAVRLTANPERVVRGGEPLVVYFEAYHLQTGPDGRSSLEFEYTVRSTRRDRRAWIQRLLAPPSRIPEIAASRREDQPGDVRRQFVTVPVKDLPPGRYRIEITVRDLRAGTAASGGADFERRVARPPGS